MYSIEEIKANYQNFEDEKIAKIAINESKSLRKDVLVILKDEIEKRGLDPRLITWVDVENHTLTDLEKITLTNKLKKLSCPNCGLSKDELSGFEINSVFSLLIFCIRSNNNRILCVKCGRNRQVSSFLSTFLMGWWSPRGLLYTPYILVKKIMDLFSQSKISKKIIYEFLEKNTGMLRLHGTDDETLTSLIRWHNDDYLIPDDEVFIGEEEHEYAKFKRIEV